MVNVSFNGELVQISGRFGAGSSRQAVDAHPAPAPRQK
jgi:hypothetical protein